MSDAYNNEWVIVTSGYDNGGAKLLDNDSNGVPHYDSEDVDYRQYGLYAQVTPFDPRPPQPTVFNHAGLLLFVIFRGTLTGVGLLTRVILLYLIIRDRIIRTTTAKLVLVSVVVFLVCESILLPLNLSQFIHGTWFTTDAGCQFYTFIQIFFWTSKGLLVSSIAIFAYIECKTPTISNGRIKFLATFTAMMIITVIAAGIRAACAGFTTFEFGEFDTKYRYCLIGWYPSRYHPFVDAVAKWVIINACTFIPVIVSVVLVIVLMCKRRGTTAPHQVVPIVIVTTFTLLWTPLFLCMILRTDGYIQLEFWGGAMFRGMMDFEFALTPILLLALPTDYNKALRKRYNKLCCRQQEVLVSQYIVELQINEYDNTSV